MRLFSATRLTAAPMKHFASKDRWRRKGEILAMLQKHTQPPEQDKVPASLLSLADASSSLHRAPRDRISSGEPRCPAAPTLPHCFLPELRR